MEKDTNITDITFRKFNSGEVIALMPHEVNDYKGHIVSYMHNGQHSGADYLYMLSITKIAKPTEYADLLNELENIIGYNVRVVLKRNYDKYLKSYREVRG